MTKKIILIILGVTLIISFAVNLVLITKPVDLSVVVPKSNNEEIQTYLKKVLLISGDSPTIAEVQDSESMKAESPYLYSEIENGDKIFVYQDKIVIFRPSTQKILQVVKISE